MSLTSVNKLVLMGKPWVKHLAHLNLLRFVGRSKPWAEGEPWVTAIPLKIPQRSSPKTHTGPCFLTSLRPEQTSADPTGLQDHNISHKPLTDTWEEELPLHSSIITTAKTTSIWYSLQNGSEINTDSLYWKIMCPALIVSDSALTALGKKS